MTLARIKNHHPATQYSNLFDTFFGGSNSNLSQFVGRDWNYTQPAVNVVETENSYRVELAAPGQKKENFSVNVEKDVLTISNRVETSGEEKKEEKTERYTRREFSYSSFKRSFTLPEHANADAIEAKYENGVLLVTIPKKEEGKEKAARTIEIG
jgi:HSP20 family protein